ncbi:MAG TPA: DUF1826 domain-containing protein [Faecalibacter sp.]
MKLTPNPSPQVELVDSFQALFDLEFYEQVNAIGWIRSTNADFKEIVDQLKLKEEITEVSMSDLYALNLSVSGQKARSIIIEDFKNLELQGAQPSLNLLKSYPIDDEFDFISTDVYSFHVDRSPVPTDTILCTYYGASSDIIPNDHVILKKDHPEIRQKLLEIYEGDESGFESFLTENYFDLHYHELPLARPYNLGNIHLWRLAVDHPNQKVRPCVHRAPKENDNELRLLMIC